MYPGTPGETTVPVGCERDRKEGSSRRRVWLVEPVREPPVWFTYALTLSGERRGDSASRGCGGTKLDEPRSCMPPKRLTRWRTWLVGDGRSALVVAVAETGFHDRGEAARCDFQASV